MVDVYPDTGPSQFTLYEDAAGTPSRTTITATPVADGIHVAIDHTEGPAPARTLTVRIRRVDHPLTAVDGALVNPVPVSMCRLTPFKSSRIQ